MNRKKLNQARPFLQLNQFKFKDKLQIKSQILIGQKTQASIHVIFAIFTRFVYIFHAFQL
jgi:hypothetical protein